jgi:uncharacterized protein
MNPVPWSVTVTHSPVKARITRRRFLTVGACAMGGLALYAGEVERHWIEISRRDVVLPGLSAAFDGFRVAQLSDIHMDEYTEPFFLRDAVSRVNSMNPDAVFLTGDYVSSGFAPKKFARGAAWQCADLLNALACRQRYAVLGNHDMLVGEKEVTEALKSNGITVFRNGCAPIERSGGRFWLCGIGDPVVGSPRPDESIPPSIRNIANEPVVLLCHAPDYADELLALPAGQAVSLMLTGHTHGGQVRLPFVGALDLPELGKKYVEGWFQLGRLQLHVNRGIGTVGVPFRFNCPPEISLLTLRAA